MTPDEIANINAYAIIFTALSTIVLAVITIFYAAETHKIRIGAMKPILTLQCDYAPGETDLARKLFLSNNGPVAQDISINTDVKIKDEIITKKIYLYSLAHRERVEILSNVYEVKDNDGEIKVRMRYYDADMKIYRSEIVVDFAKMTSDRIITTPESATQEMSDIGDALLEISRKQ
jgi:hypothetical protein